MIISTSRSQLSQDPTIRSPSISRQELTLMQLSFRMGTNFFLGKTWMAAGVPAWEEEYPEEVVERAVLVVG